jgi:murein L,D-transpeptidase YcbB/YkuD
MHKRACLTRVAAALTVAAAVGGCKGDQRTGSGRIHAVLTGEDAPVVTLVTGDTLHLQPSVVKFYEDRSYEPAWTDNDEILERGRTMLEALRQATEDGLDPERYQYSVADRLAGVLAKDSVDDINDGLEELAYLGDLDIILTEGFYRYGKDLAEGTLDPKASGLVWRIPRGEPPNEQLIVDVLNGADPAETLRALRPATPYYARMMKALAHYSEVEANGGWQRVEAGKVKVGETNAAAVALRRRLIAEGDPTEAELAGRGMADSARFDGDLAAALAHFQSRHGLVPDSALGSATLAELNAPVSQRVLALKINLDRWRWLPRALGDRFVMVNIAGFEMELVEHDEPALSMNVVVGKEAWETPVFSDTM